MDAEIIEDIIRVTIRWPNNRVWNSKSSKDCRIASLFGAPSTVIADLWNHIEPSAVEEAPGVEPKHLLWGLLFLKVYATSEEVNCSIVGWPHSDTFRKWSWYFVRKIFELQSDVIVWENRFIGQPKSSTGEYLPQADCMISVDWTDCPCYEPYPFSTEMYSEKFNGPAIRYEVGICIATSYIVWINGPFPAGTSEKGIFDSELSKRLEDWEMVEADSGLRGTLKAKTPNQGIDSKQRKEKSVIRGRHENINGRLKIFNVLNASFHHTEGRDRETMIGKHGMCFAAVAVITQLKLEQEGGLYHVNYDVRYTTT